jgi:hypothetical protein|nr:MAG TPA: dissimilatory sulfite reductase D [Caudoviricetes sp.]
MEQQIINIIKNKQKSSGGNCGTYPVNIMNSLNIDYKSVRATLNKLHKEGKILIREGLHGKLVFWK